MLGMPSGVFGVLGWHLWGHWRAYENIGKTNVFLRFEDLEVLERALGSLGGLVGGPWGPWGVPRRFLRDPWGSLGAPGGSL